jgi:2-polyprenyl-3-methyl-5-hydroxy-6-metoxy-1,4-benzoquinol methylase
LVIVKGNRGADFIAKKHRVVICENCGLVFLNPQHSEEDYDRFYSNQPTSPVKSADYIKQNYNNIKKLTDLRDFILANADRSAISGLPKLLDIGCGHGAFLYCFKDSGFELFGLEPGEGAAKFAREELGLKIYESMLDDNSLPSEEFDIITALALIEHVNDPLDALKKIRRLLRPGGYLFLTTPDFKTMVLRRGISNFFKFVHTFYFTETTLGSLMEQAGFKVLKSWTKPPSLKHSTLFNPMDCKSGVLHIFAQRIETNQRILPRKDDVLGLIKLFQKIKKRDYPYHLMSRVISFNHFLKNKLKLAK